MKYGMRERVSGALILIALAVIFVPLLFDEPAPREERPEPVLTIEQPIDVEHRDLEEPVPPESLDADRLADDSQGASTNTETEVTSEPVESVVSEGGGASRESASDAAVQAEERQVEEAQAVNENGDGPSGQASTAEQADDPIAELARAADERQAEATPGGDWAVQVGSFGQVDNAERLQARLKDQGYPAYRRARDNDLTTVYVGPYDSSEVAENVMGKLKAGLNLQGLLVRVE
ncbi:SPOR domain-containing protein [Halomonas sp. I1]|uniref:SPOR domain-containing protein n=1 Tax=Halomonas sp. I1 TaxID=393536 RepID=UPI0028DD4F74|nr:SPOR domain-containing protein [Halomonas sp. I1]MDT8896192.1 SPOR domain-containing protein [Halomonas sp. I1]